jgi:hypothetical protein
MTATTTPSDLTIKPRNIAFGRGARNARWWHCGDPIATTFYNALSLSFPEGEGYFVRSVRQYIDELPEPLRSQVVKFARQESYHSREHMAFNRQVADAGYDTREIEEFNRQDALKAKDDPSEVNLAATAAAEHLTAILAHILLTNDRHLAGLPEDIRQLWTWHALEEIEHKSVAFDTFLYVTRDLSAFKRWIFRVLVMRQLTKDFWGERVRDIRLLFQQDNLDVPRTWRRLLMFLFVRPGLLRQILPHYLAWYLPGFHPWRLDDRKLAAEVEDKLKLDETPATV